MPMRCVWAPPQVRFGHMSTTSIGGSAGEAVGVGGGDPSILRARVPGTGCRASPATVLVHGRQPSRPT